MHIRWISPELESSDSNSSDSKTAVPRLPAEILAIISGEINDRKTLCALSSVSHAWNQLAQPRLYRSIRFAESRLESFDRFCSRIEQTLKALQEKLHLADSVRELNVNDGNNQLWMDIASMASLCPNLTKLDLGDNTRLQDEGLLGILEKCRSLEELSIAGCSKITSEGFVKVLPFLKNLRKLNVSCTLLISDDSLCEIAKMCPLLEDLDLERTEITRTGVSSIIALASNLTALDLSECYAIEDLEMIAIMKEKPSHLKITNFERGMWDR